MHPVSSNRLQLRRRQNHLSLLLLTQKEQDSVTKETTRKKDSFQKQKVLAPREFLFIPKDGTSQVPHGPKEVVPGLVFLADTHIAFSFPNTYNPHD